MTITADTPLGELVTMNPATAALLRRLGIDYFCRGHQLLGDALREHNVSVDAFARELFRVNRTASNPWQRATLRGLIGHIVDTHHEYLRNELPVLDGLTGRIADDPAAAKPAFLAALQTTIHELRRNLELQMQKEETILFPAIAELERVDSSAEPCVAQFGSLANLVRVMGKEHEKALRALATISNLTNDVTPISGTGATLTVLFVRLKALIADMHRHIHLENNILYPRAIELEKGG
jgi:regulator of cell morphogenesis and NO signaling